MLNGLTGNEIIYKYFPVKFLVPLLSDKLLWVNHTSNWEDVYENFFLKNEFVYGNQSGRADKLIGCVYGQSWTLQDESDAMWRIYSNKYRESCAVRIRTTVNKLFSVIFPKGKDLIDLQTSTFIGKVKYLTDDELFAWQQRSIPVNEVIRTMVDSFFLKRTPFEHEQEVRIIRTIPGDFCNVGVESLLFKIDPDDLIEEYVIEPRLSDVQASAIKNQLVDLGVQPGKIRQSDLYKFKPSKIVIE